MIKLSGNVPAGLVLAVTVFNILLFLWTIYFIIKIAQHVNAWPF